MTDKRILLITDAWKPQVNGVVTTLTNIVHQANLNGDHIEVFHPGLCSIEFPLPSYKEINIGVPDIFRLKTLIQDSQWDRIHIATIEGTIGYISSRICKANKIPFSTSCHTKFPEFLSNRYKWIPEKLLWKLMKSVYNDSDVILTTADSMKNELIEKGFDSDKVHVWSRGVNRSIFFPVKQQESLRTLLCVSRVSHEKGLDDFCKLNIPNTRKVLVGDGPYLNELRQNYNDVEFVGKKTGTELAEYYQNASVFVFPSKADTFGVVNIESIACGTPVAAYPVTGPIDIIENGINGHLSDSLTESVQNCFDLDRTKVYESSTHWTWETCYTIFYNKLFKQT